MFLHTEKTITVFNVNNKLIIIPLKLDFLKLTKIKLKLPLKSPFEEIYFKLKDINHEKY